MYRLNIKGYVVSRRVAFVIFVLVLHAFRPFVLSWFNSAGWGANPRPLPRPDLRRRTYCNFVKIVYNFTIEGCEFTYKVYGA
jgi:hypothetical protein